MSWEQVIYVRGGTRWRHLEYPRLQKVKTGQSIQYLVDGVAVDSADVPLLLVQPPPISSYEYKVLCQIRTIEEGGYSLGRISHEMYRALVDKGCLNDKLQLTELGRTAKPMSGVWIGGYDDSY
jgi:hypothetical protein